MPTNSSCSIARLRAAAPPCFEATSMFSSTVRLAKILVSWKVRPIPKAKTLSGATLVIFLPPRYTCPASALAYPVMTLNKVVLPDPFGPIRPATEPSSISPVHALDSCTEEIDEGSVAGLIGPNGSGKTTLFNVITGYAKADAGQVYLGGKKITNVAPDKVFAFGIGRTFQLTRIFASLTVLENMLVASKHGGAAARRRAMEQLEFVGIAGHRAALAGTLSYGQRKLLELAYVLVSDPAVILLDEPAGGVNLSLVNH